MGFGQADLTKQVRTAIITAVDPGMRHIKIIPIFMGKINSIYHEISIQELPGQSRDNII